MSENEQQSAQPAPQPQAGQETSQPTSQVATLPTIERTIIVSDVMQVRNAAQRETVVKVDRPQEDK